MASPTETHCRFARSFLQLAWPESLASRILDSSLGVHQRSPLRQYRCRASCPEQAEARPSVRGCHAPNTFRPCRSYRLRRFTPLDTLQVYCTLHPAMRFAMFPARPAPFVRRLWRTSSPFPMALHPTKLSPPQQAGPRHRVPVPSRRCSELLVVGPPVLPRLALRPSARHPTSGFCSATKSVASQSAFPPTSCPILPWAWSQSIPKPSRRSAKKLSVGKSLRSRRTVTDLPRDPAAASLRPKVEHSASGITASRPRPKGLGLARARTGPESSVVPPTRHPPEGGGWPAPQLGRLERMSGEGWARLGRRPGAPPRRMRVSPERNETPFVPAASCLLRLRPGGRLRGGVPWLSSWVSVVSVRAPGGVLSRRVGGSFFQLAASRGRLPKVWSRWSFAMGLTLDPQPRSGLPKKSFPWHRPWAFAVARARQVLLPWSVPQGSWSGSSLPEESFTWQVSHGPSSWFWRDESPCLLDSRGKRAGNGVAPSPRSGIDRPVARYELPRESVAGLERGNPSHRLGAPEGAPGRWSRPR